jgi:hypothetical protein
MGRCRLGFVVFAASCLLIGFKLDPASAQGSQALAIAHGFTALGIAPLSEGVVHRRRAKSFYCYPRNYWWFYRPYTTAPQGYPRCMPYFHYLDPAYDRRGSRDGRIVE